MAAMFTPTQKKFLKVLQDGKPHSARELRGCVNDELACQSNLGVHLLHFRRRLRAVGQELLTEYTRQGLMYRHVILLKNKRSLTPIDKDS